MLRKYSTLFLVFLLALGFAARGEAQIRHGGGGWQYLGNAHVDGNADHDKIACHGKDTFRALQLRVKGSAVHFDHVVVEYGNHTRDTLPVRRNIAAGASSGPIDLRGANRDIAFVEIWYQKGNWGTKPEVRLYGRP
jgi:hypothetical protein